MGFGVISFISLSLHFILINKESDEDAQRAVHSRFAIIAGFYLIAIHRTSS